MQSFEERKKDAVQKIGWILLESLEKGELADEEGQIIARAILVEKERVTDDISLKKFIEDLSSKWPIFQSYWQLYQQTQQTSTEDQQKLELVKKQLEDLSNPTN